MLSEKPWKLDAIGRLVLNLWIGVLVGSLLVSLVNFSTDTIKGSGLIYFSLFFGALSFLAAALVLVNKPWAPESHLHRLISIAVCCFGGVLLAGLVQGFRTGPTAVSTLSMGIAMVSFQGAAIVFIDRFLREHQIGWGEAFGLDLPRLGRTLSRALLVGIVALPVAWFLGAMSVHALTWLQIEPKEQQSVQTLKATVSWGQRFFFGLTALVLAPVVEEFLFRGILYPTLKQIGHPRLAWWGSALLFALIHFNLATFASLTFLALMLTWLYEETNTLLAPIITHSFFNAANFYWLLWQQAVVPGY
ncbi:MAG: CPBP family intramembrane glutamic endopeptidase [Verrucomicrobiota bacterium]